MEVPFALWGDHLMVARGSPGTPREINWFVDNGLVAFDENEGRVAFLTPVATLQT